MTQTDILREFLVKLGFKIDASGERKFVDTVASMTVSAVKLGTAITAASASVTAGVAAISSGLESLHFASQRTRASAENIQALGFAVSQMGGSADGARTSLEHLARLMRTNPGTSGLLRSLGVNTQDAQGQLRDTSTLLMELGERLKRMPYYRAYVYAQALGIDEKTLYALQQDLGQFSATYRAMLRASGLDMKTAAKSSHAFMNELRLLGVAAGILWDKVGSLLTDRMGADIKRFREFLVAHFDQISKGIAVLVGWILKAADVISTLSIRAMQAINAIVNWFNQLSGSGQNLIKMLGLMLIAWRLLSKGFMATPLGRVMALVTALLLLWDDYQVWKEGGESLIDWSKWEPAITAALDALKNLCDWLGKGVEAIGGWKTVAEVVLAYFSVKWVTGMLSAISKVGKALLQVRMPQIPAESPPGKAYQLGTLLGRSLKWLLKGGRLVKGGAGLYTLLHSESLNAGEEEEIRRIREKEQQWLQNRNITALENEPRGIRNYNPGNIEYGSFARSHGALGSDGRFAQFRSAEAGLKALADLLQVYAKKDINTIHGIIARFAPAHENNTKAYIASVAKSLGFEANAKLNMHDPRVIAGLMNAIVQIENGKNPYSVAMVNQIAATNAADAPSMMAVHKGNQNPWGTGLFNLDKGAFDLDRATQAVAATSAPNPYRMENSAGASNQGRASDASEVLMNQTLNITVNGVNNPQEAADAIQQAQQNTNALLIRNLRGAVIV